MHRRVHTVASVGPYSCQPRRRGSATSVTVRQQRGGTAPRPRQITTRPTRSPPRASLSARSSAVAATAGSAARVMPRLLRRTASDAAGSRRPLGARQAPACRRQQRPEQLPRPRCRSVTGDSCSTRRRRRPPIRAACRAAVRLHHVARASPPRPSAAPSTPRCRSRTPAAPASGPRPRAAFVVGCSRHSCASASTSITDRAPRGLAARRRASAAQRRRVSTATGIARPPACSASRSAGYAGSSGTYAPPAFRTASSATTSSSERSRQTPTRASGPTPQRRAAGAPAVRARVQLAYVSARALGRDRHRVRRPRRLRLEQLVEARSASDTLAAVSFHASSTCARSAVVEQRQRAEPHVRVRRDLLQQRAKVPQHPLDRRRVEEVGAVVQRRQQALARSPRATRSQVELGARRERRHRRRSRRAPAAAARRAPAFCSANITWKSGVWLRRRAPAAAPPPAARTAVLVRVGAERRLAHPPQQLAEARVARRGRCAATSVLTKKPISSSISARVRLAIGVPTDDVLAARCTRQQHLEGRQQRHEQRRALAAGPAPAAAPAAPRESSTGTVRAPVRLHRRPRPVGRQLQQRRRAGQLLPPVAELPLQHARPSSRSRCQTA